jgi:hypothetical protein
LNLAKQTGTALSIVEDHACIFDQNGEVIGHDIATELLDLVWEIIREAFKYSNEECSNISPEKSLKDFFIEQVAEKRLSAEDQMLVLQMAEMWGAFIGDPLERQSLKYFWLEECLDGGELDYCVPMEQSLIMGWNDQIISMLQAAMPRSCTKWQTRHSNMRKSSFAPK